MKITDSIVAQSYSHVMLTETVRTEDTVVITLFLMLNV